MPSDWCPFVLQHLGGCPLSITVAAVAAAAAIAVAVAIVVRRSSFVGADVCAAGAYGAAGAAGAAGCR
eukprot:8867471-Alexandrium_andersonii.AAC.1